jgi:HlyD family secretion protein
MDIPRADRARAIRRRRLLLAAGGVVAVALITLALARLKPAAPTVEEASLWIDTVKRGPMVRQVRGPGTLVPEEVRWIAAATEGRVDRVLVLAGSPVEADTVLLVLASLEVEQAAAEAEAQLRAGEADYQDLEAQLESQVLAQESQLAGVEADYQQARLQAEADAELAKEGLVSELTHKLSTLRAEQLGHRFEIETQRSAKAGQSVAAQLAANRARLEQLRALYGLRRQQVESLQVRASIAGVLQQVPVEVGQRVAPGTILARVAVPERLRAELRIAETQAKDIEVGQVAAIDTRNGVVPGRVTRIDPAAQEGTVQVDVALEGALPRGARPDLSVDGTVELERLADILYVGRPAYGQSGSTVGLFKLIDDGSHAVRVPVALGRSSVNTIEVVSGLDAGDRVILTDMSAWDAFDRVRLD